VRIKGQRGCIVIGSLITMAIMAALIPVFAAAILHIKLYLDDPIVEPAEDLPNNYIQEYVRASMPRTQDRYNAGVSMTYDSRIYEKPSMEYNGDSPHNTYRSRYNWQSRGSY